MGVDAFEAVGLCTKFRSNKLTLGFPICWETDWERFIDESDSKLEPLRVEDKYIFSTVCLSSSTEADIGAAPLLRGLISTWIFRSPMSSRINEKIMIGVTRVYYFPLNVKKNNWLHTRIGIRRRIKALAWIVPVVSGIWSEYITIFIYFLSCRFCRSSLTFLWIVLFFPVRIKLFSRVIRNIINWCFYVYIKYVID